MDKLINIERGFTHAGSFHSDDVFATAFLKILNPDIKIERGNQVPEDFDGIVFDIGWGRFDHHQKDKRIRENGVPYAAFGLLWEEYGTKILDAEDVEDFDYKFIQPLDNSDNTGEYSVMASAISDWNYTWEEEGADINKVFFEAVDFAKGILERYFKQALSRKKAYEIVKEMVDKAEDKVLVMEKSIPWKKALKESDIEYVIYPSLRGGYNIQAVPKKEKEDDKEVLKCPFPESWRGKSADELKEITGVETLRFCHNSGFLAAADTLEDAKKTAKKSIETDSELGN